MGRDDISPAADLLGAGISTGPTNRVALWLATTIRAALHAVSGGAVPEYSRTLIRIHEIATGRVVFEQDWGHDGEGAAAALQTMRADLDRMTLDAFCEAYGVRL